MKVKINTWFLAVCPYLLIVLAIVGPWLLKPGYIFLTDLSWGPIIPLDMTIAWFYPYLILKSFAWLFSSGLAERLLLFSAICLPLVGGVMVARSLRIKNRWLCFLISLFTLFNPFVYDRFLYGQIGVVLAYGFFLLSIAELVRNNYELDFTRRLGLAGLWSGLAFMFAPHFIFIVGLIFMVFIVVNLYNSRSHWRAISIGFFLAILVAGGLNTYWLLPNLLNNGSTSQDLAGIGRQDIVAFQTAGSGNLDTYKNVIMMSGFWGKDQYRYYDLTKLKDNWGRSFLLLLPIILCGLYFGLRKKETRLLSVGLFAVYIIAVVLAVGVKAPITGGISWWLYDHLPFYKSLREPQKWVSVIVMVYLVFLALGTDELSKIKWLKDKKVIAGLFLCGVIVMQAPLFFWGFAGQVKAISYPTDWYQADQLIKLGSYKVRKAECNQNTLFLPWHQYLGFKWIGGVISNPSPKFFSCPIISGTNMEWGGIYDNSTNVRGQDIDKWLISSGADSSVVLDKYQIHYIILAKEVDWVKYNWLDKLSGWSIIQDGPTLRVYGKK